VEVGEGVKESLSLLDGLTVRLILVVVVIVKGLKLVDEEGDEGM
jgi:hypothetical protein